MKIKLCFLLLLILSAFSSSGAVIVGTSDPFPLDTSSPVPISWIAMAIAAASIGAYTLLRRVRPGEKGSG